MEIYATLPKSANSSLKGLGGNDAGDDYFLLENMGYRVGLALVER